MLLPLLGLHQVLHQSLQNSSSLLGRHFVTENTPAAVNWVDEGAVTPVKNQGQCGSCWSFSAVEAVESAWALSKGELLVLSEQQILDCDKNESSCSGGEMDSAFEYVKENGLCLEKDYKYVEKDESCKTNCTPVVHISGYHDVDSNNEKSFIKALLKQPLSVAIEADQLVFQFYNKGIIKHNCGSNLDHGVVAVGYGTDYSDSDEGTDYLILRNSWGAGWGMDGYFRLKRDKNANNGAGVCGVLAQPSYPIV